MLDGEVPEKVDKVRGFAVPTRSGGRRKWPEELRAMAVERIAAGEGTQAGFASVLMAHGVAAAVASKPG